MKPRVRVTYSLTQDVIDFVRAVSLAADRSASGWLDAHLARLSRGATAAPAPVAPAAPIPTPQQPSPSGVPSDWVRVTLVESDAGKTAYLSPSDAGITG